MEINENEIQEKCSEFVKREVYNNQSMLVEKLFDKLIFEWTDIENYYCPVKEGEEETPQEIFEWWLISEHLAVKVK